jgi:formylglycine-generating enzyme required for sulfatase activity
MPPTLCNVYKIGTVFGFCLLAILGVAVRNRDPDFSVAPVFVQQVIHTPTTAIYVARFEVSVAEWNMCADEKACPFAITVRKGTRAQQTPATGISWLDAQDYIAWINRKTRHVFRLPSGDEWKAIAADVIPKKPDPIFTDPNLRWASAYQVEGLPNRALLPRGSNSVTKDGVADLDGSVWEWTSDCYNADVTRNRCPAFVAAGMHMSIISPFTRDPARGGCAVGSPPAHLGLRLITDSAPF